ncbi:MAG: purine-nucleoside phosphorylase [Lachnospiraceae bacterium]|nr:purine-nucleoside phosphorylase [Lachnospiraceae bacterium]
MNPVYEKLMTVYDNVKDRVPFVPKAALVLGSGLGDYADSIEVVSVLDYHNIQGFPISTVKGHKGRFVFGYVDTVPTVIMQGRVHYYEGYSMQDVVLPARLMKQMGAEILFLTNASGGINREFQAGSFMLITDHISCFVPNPLIGENVEELGVRFPDMTQIYNRELCNVIRQSAADLSIPLQEGIYAQMTGPSYECPAEIRMLRTLGADAVGMSTACEAIAAHHMGMKVCGVSCISNMASGITNQPLTHTEVQETADQAAPLFKKLITESIIRMADII